MSEQDRLAGERKLVELLVGRYGGKAGHSSLLNSSQMRKREFNENVNSLIERDALSVDTFRTQTKHGKLYVVNPEILESWTKPGQTPAQTSEGGASDE